MFYTADFTLMPALETSCGDKKEMFDLKNKKQSSECALRNCALAVAISDICGLKEKKDKSINGLVVESANNLTMFYLALFQQACKINPIQSLCVVSNTTNWKLRDESIPFNCVSFHYNLNGALLSEKRAKEKNESDGLDFCFLDVCNSAVGAIQYVCNSFRTLRMKPKSVWGFSFQNSRHRVSYDTEKYDKDTLEIMDEMGHFRETENLKGGDAHLRYVLLFIKIAAKKQGLHLEKVWYGNNANAVQTMVFIVHKETDTKDMFTEYNDMQVFYKFWSNIHPLDVTLSDYVLHVLDEINCIDDVVSCKEEHLLREKIHRECGTEDPIEDDDYLILPGKTKKHKAGVACSGFLATRAKNKHKRVQMVKATLEDIDWCAFCARTKRSYISF